MLNRRVFGYLFIICSFVFVLLLTSNNSINASYSGCDLKVEGTSFYDCGNKVYTYYEDKQHSSYIVSLNNEASIVYGGEKEGLHIFYSSGFDYYNFSYDDRSDANNNLWAKITKKGSVVFDGEFDDSWLIDDSHSGVHRFSLYSEVYTIRQYHENGKLYRTMVIYNFKDDNIEFLNPLYDNSDLSLNQINEVLDSKVGISVTMNSVYGIKRVLTEINGNVVDNKIVSNMVNLNASDLNNNLIKGEIGTVKITAYDYLGNRLYVEYELLLVNNEVLIKFSTMTSIVESASRRIVINATAGKGKTIDTDYCWYYWSTSPDDSLVYEDFLKNYANSKYKGNYSEDKGVILRNTSGTYYLYALAKDDDSSTVIRSEGYILNNSGHKVTYNIYDAIFVVSLLIIAIIPISIYLFIRKKGY